MRRPEFLEWLISLRSNFSDYYTFNLRKLGWEAEEFFITDYYIDKVAQELYGGGKGFKKFTAKIKDKVFPVSNRWMLNVMIDYINKYNPDVIFVREITGVPSEFWRTFGNKRLIVCRIASQLPKYWSPLDWDLIFTSTEVYKTFFEINNVPAIINANGFDRRVVDELKSSEKIYDVTFVGQMNPKHFSGRIKTIEFIAGRVNFKWWGIGSSKIPKDSFINKTRQGVTSGLEMLQIYRQSKMVLNDYIEMAKGAAVNQRMFEVMGAGSLLITREAENLKKEFPENVFVTFKNENDCLDKINYYLKNEKEREEIAKEGQKFILENFDYGKLMRQVGEALRKHFETKFSKSTKTSL